MFAPAGIPKDIRATLNSAMRKALQVAEVREGLVKQGIEPEVSSPEELAEYLKKSISVFRGAIEKANLKPSSD
jgi:tripartite-type tricarboxylate transporter receptor subunit TctC